MADDEVSVEDEDDVTDGQRGGHPVVTKTPSQYENIPRHRSDESTFLGILKTINGNEIFNRESNLANLACAQVCRMNQIMMSASPDIIGKGNAVRVQVKVTNPDLPLLKNNFTFADTECIFYIIDSRPQASDSGTLRRNQTLTAEKEAARFLPEENVEFVDEECICLPAKTINRCLDSTESWVEENSRCAVIAIFSLSLLLFVVSVILAIIASLWSYQTCTYNADANALTDKNINLSATHEEADSLSLQQLYEKQQRDLGDSGLACDVVYASKSVDRLLEPNDTIIEWTIGTQRISLAVCPVDASCPMGYQCSVENFAQKKVAVHLTENNFDKTEGFASRDITEATSCSCQAIEDLEDIDYR